MECRDIEALISAIHDGEPVTPEERAAVQAHCDECASCAAFSRALERLDRAPSPVAPAGLADRVMREVDAYVEESHRATAAAASAPAAEPEAASAPAVAPIPRRRPAWVVGSWVAAAAAVLLVAGVWGSGLLSHGGKAATETLDGRTVISVAPGSSGAQSSAATAAATAAPVAGAPVVVPDVVAFSNRVFTPGPTVDASGSALTTVGTVASSFDANGSIVQAPAYRPPLADGSLLVQAPSGMMRFLPVVRTYEGATWQLASGDPLLHYGTWPRLPSTFPAPAAADGSPTFRQAGVDSGGVPIYTPGGAKPTDGFAIAPGTGANDPARGNPNWTWWTTPVKP